LATLRENRYLTDRIAVEKILEHPGRQAGPIIVDTDYEIVAGGTA
jgi:hypothetical protein